MANFQLLKKLTLLKEKRFFLMIETNKYFCLFSIKLESLQKCKNHILITVM